MQNKGHVLQMSWLNHMFHPGRVLCPLFPLCIPLNIPPVSEFKKKKNLTHLTGPQESLLSHFAVFDSAIKAHISTSGLTTFHRIRKKQPQKASTDFFPTYKSF